MAGRRGRRQPAVSTSGDGSAACCQLAFQEGSGQRRPRRRDQACAQAVELGSRASCARRRHRHRSRTEDEWRPRPRTRPHATQNPARARGWDGTKAAKSVSQRGPPAATRPHDANPAIPRATPRTAAPSRSARQRETPPRPARAGPPRGAATATIGQAAASRPSRRTPSGPGRESEKTRPASQHGGGDCEAEGAPIRARVEGAASRACDDRSEAPDSTA